MRIRNEELGILRGTEVGGISPAGDLLCPRRQSRQNAVWKPRFPKPSFGCPREVPPLPPARSHSGLGPDPFRCRWVSGEDLFPLLPSARRAGALRRGVLPAGPHPLRRGGCPHPPAAPDPQKSRRGAQCAPAVSGIAACGRGIDRLRAGRGLERFRLRATYFARVGKVGKAPFGNQGFQNLPSGALRGCSQPHRRGPIQDWAQTPSAAAG